MKMNKVGVIIPFFQRKEGILTNALNSIGKQNVKGVTFTIVIVDDASPVKVESEIENAVLPDNCTIKLISQKNSGPAVARNVGLDYLASCDVSIAAFLDSDDLWKEQHISLALLALEDSADFYFCNHTRFSFNESWFSSFDCFNNWDDTLSDYSITLNESKQLASLSGAKCFTLFIQHYLSQTSTVVYNFERHKSMRFNPQLVNAGEDYFFWLQLVSQSDKVSFTREQNVHCGEGVNLYFSSFDWNKLCSSTKAGHHFFLQNMILYTFTLDDTQSKQICKDRERYFNRYSYLMVKHIIKGIGFDRRLAVELFKRYPLDMLTIPFRFIRASLNKGSLEE